MKLINLQFKWNNYYPLNVNTRNFTMNDANFAFTSADVQAAKIGTILFLFIGISRPLFLCQITVAIPSERRINF